MTPVACSGDNVCESGACVPKGIVAVSPDAGDLDAGSVVDAGHVDLDAGPGDAAVVDAGHVELDAGELDAGPGDAAVVDAGHVDLDAGPADAAVVDAGYAGGEYVDGGYVDGGYDDGGYVDAGPLDPGPPLDRVVCIGDGGALPAPCWEKYAGVFGPEPRVLHSFSYNPLSGEAILHGGLIGADIGKDTYRWNGTKWSRTVYDAGVSVFDFGNSAFDSNRGATVLVSGGTFLSGLTNVVQYFSRPNWIGESNGNPTRRAVQGAALAFDASRRLLVSFGGTDSDAGITAETWTSDGLGSWAPGPTSGGPPARTGHMMAYDSIRNEIVLFGGLSINESTSAAETRNDTWTLDAIGWHDVTPNPNLGLSPPGLTQAAMAFDPGQGRVVLLGGRESVDGPPTDQVWLWDGETATWSRGIPGPPPRWGAQMTYDPIAGGLVLFGGSSTSPNATPLDDTWLFRAPLSLDVPLIVDDFERSDPLDGTLGRTSVPGIAWNDQGGFDLKNVGPNGGIDGFIEATGTASKMHLTHGRSTGEANFELTAVLSFSSVGEGPDKSGSALVLINVNAAMNNISTGIGVRINTSQGSPAPKKAQLVWLNGSSNLSVIGSGDGLDLSNLQVNDSYRFTVQKEGLSLVLSMCNLATGCTTSITTTESLQSAADVGIGEELYLELTGKGAKPTRLHDISLVRTP